MHDDFDTARRAGRIEQATFTIAGEKFTYRPQCGADIIAAYFDAQWDTDSPTLNSNVVKTCDEIVLAMLVPEDHDRWRAVRDPRAPDPINIRDLQTVAERMLEVMADRPTESSSDSGTSLKASGTSSTDDSASTEAT